MNFGVFNRFKEEPLNSTPVTTRAIEEEKLERKKKLRDKKHKAHAFSQRKDLKQTDAKMLEEKKTDKFFPRLLIIFHFFPLESERIFGEKKSESGVYVVASARLSCRSFASFVSPAL